MKLLPSSLAGLVYAILRVVGVLFLIIAGLLYFFQEKLIFHPSKLVKDAEFSFPQSFVEKYVQVDGIQIHSLLFAAKNSRGLILYFHGNAGSLEDWGSVASELSERSSFDVFIFDYPGFGKSEGAIVSEEQLHRVAEAVFLEAMQLSAAQKRLVIYGRSIGTGIATRLSAVHSTPELILESPYYNLVDLVSQIIPIAPTPLLRYKFRSDLSIAKLEDRILILHGSDDEVIPLSQAEKLSRLAKNGKFITIPGGHHNDLSAFSFYWDSLEEFLSR